MIRVAMRPPSLEANQKRYIVVSRNWTSAPDLRLLTRAKLDTGIAGYLEPYDRVAEVSREVQSMSLEANSDDNVVVHWVDESESCSNSKATIARD